MGVTTDRQAQKPILMSCFQQTFKHVSIITTLSFPGKRSIAPMTAALKLISVPKVSFL